MRTNSSCDCGGQDSKSATIPLYTSITWYNPYKYTFAGHLQLAYASGRDGVGMRGNQPLNAWDLLKRCAMITGYSVPFNIARWLLKPGYHWQNALVDSLTKYYFAWGQYFPHRHNADAHENRRLPRIFRSHHPRARGARQAGGAAFRPDRGSGRGEQPEIPPFDLEQRMEWLREVFADEPRVSVDSFEGLTAHFCKRIGARYLLRGTSERQRFRLRKDHFTAE